MLLEAKSQHFPRSVPGLSIKIIRFFDIFVALAGLAVLFGVLVPLLWFFITKDGGTFFFRQKRVGKNRKNFTIWKIRTMRTNIVVDDLQVSGPHDLRRTRLGIILRRFRIDEFPQFINVLLGDMSVVGPRPETPGRFEYLTRRIPGYERRVEETLPGITGWAQVYGDYGATDEDEEVKHVLDLRWIENKKFSFWPYLYIIIRTPLVMILKRGF